MRAFRAGLAPVVATIVLVLIVIVAGGGTYAWFTSVVAAEKAEAEAALATSTQVRDVRCADTSAIVAISNTGEAALDTDRATAFLSHDGAVVDTVQKELAGTGVLEAGGFSQLEFPFTTYLEPETRYTVEVSFQGTDVTVEDSCQAGTGSLIGYWNFDGQGSRTVVDLAGSNNGTFNGAELNGTFQGMLHNGTLGWTGGSDGADPAWVTGCVRKGCLDFDGSDNVTVPSHPGLNLTDEVTVMAWVEPQVGTTHSRLVEDDAFNIYWESGEAGRTERPFRMYIRGDDGSRHYADGVTRVAGQNVTAGTRVHVTLTFNGTHIRQYHDGNLVVENTWTGGLDHGSRDLLIGSYSAGSRAWTGLIDELRVYNQSLSASSITAAMDGQPPEDGIVAYYPFDEESGQTAWNNVFQAPGKQGQGMRFDGSAGHHVLVDDTTGLDPDRLSVSVWVKPASLSSGVHRVFQRQSGTWGLYRNSDEMTFYADTGDDGGSWLATTFTIPSGDVDTWMHIAGTYDGSALRLYRDGTEMDSVAQSGAVDDGGSDAYIGTHDGSSQFWNGSMDDLRIYDRALSPSEIQNDMDGEPPQNGILAYYPMDEPTGRTVWNTGFRRQGKQGGAIALDGVDDHIAIGDGTGLDLDSQLTMAAWVNLRDTSVEQHFLDKRDDWQSSAGYAMFVSSNTLYLEYGNGTTFQQAGQNAGISADTWTHLAVVKGSQVRYYADGELLGTDSTLENGIGTNDVAFALGKSIGRGAQEVNGTMDEVRLYDAALSTARVQALYNATK